ncbi:MAG: aminotransferase class V-fold PLP-dependent enzyme [Oscillospiraceae bacterium]
MLYFDNSATSYPKPSSVKQAVSRAVTDYGANPGRSGYKMAMETSSMIYAARENLGTLFGAESQNVAFTLNCTHALNIAIKGLLKKGDHVLISDLEHNSVLRPIQKLCDDGIISYDVFTYYDDDDRTLGDIKSKLTNKTRLVISTHVSNVFGFILPIRKIGEMCREKGIYFMVDGAQSAGQLEINIEDDFIDFLCVPGHKGLYGTCGTGAIITKWGSILDTLMEGGTGTISLSKEMPEEMPERHEAGTINTVGIISLKAGTDYVLKKGIKNIFDYEKYLAQYVYNSLIKEENIIVYSSSPQGGKNVPIITFNIKGKNSDEVSTALAKIGIAVRGGFHCSYLAHKKMGTEDIGAVRISIGSFNTINQCEILVSEIKKLL